MRPASPNAGPLSGRVAASSFCTLPSSSSSSSRASATIERGLPVTIAELAIAVNDDVIVRRDPADPRRPGDGRPDARTRTAIWTEVMHPRAPRRVRGCPAGCPVDRVVVAADVPGLPASARPGLPGRVRHGGPPVVPVLAGPTGREYAVGRAGDRGGVVPPTAGGLSAATDGDRLRGVPRWASRAGRLRRHPGAPAVGAIHLAAIAAGRARSVPTRATTPLPRIDQHDLAGP